MLYRFIFYFLKWFARINEIIILLKKIIYLFEQFRSINKIIILYIWAHQL